MRGGIAIRGGPGRAPKCHRFYFDPSHHCPIAGAASLVPFQQRALPDSRPLPSSSNGSGLTYSVWGFLGFGLPPFQLTGSHFPQDQLQTVATFRRGRTISFSLLG